MNADASPSAWQDMSQWLGRIGPGLLLALTVAAAANFASLAYGAPAMLVALLLGLALNVLSQSEATKPGLQLAAKPVLQVGVALLGLQISLAQVIGLGLETVLLVVAGVLVSIGAGLLIARLTGSTAAFGVLAGGATGICGASAALAISSALPQHADKERDTAFVIAGVTTLSTIAMVVYPIIAGWLGFDERTTGIMLGATIHDVAQVVGAGYGVSPEAGDTATVVKLFRVALLLPSVFCIALAFSHSTKGLKKAKLPLPLFVLAFAVLVAVNSLGFVPALIQAPLSELSRWCLIVAVAAIGIRTPIVEMVKMGRRAVIVPVGATLVLLGFIITLQKLGL